MLGLAACLLLFGFGALARASDSPYQRGELTEMNSVACGMEEKSGQGFVAEMSGSDISEHTTHALLCPEYVVEGEKVTFHIRPRGEKHPTLLPVGEIVRFRLDRDRMLLRLADADEKEREYDVISMKVRKLAVSEASPSSPSTQ